MGAMAFRPYYFPELEPLYSPKRLPQFPASEIIGRVTDPDVDIRNRPANDPGLNTSIGKLSADTLVEWNREVIGNVIGGLANQRYVVYLGKGTLGTQALIVADKKRVISVRRQSPLDRILGRSWS